jgi:hypothetical protein
MKNKGCGIGKSALLLPQFIFKASCTKHDELYERGGGLREKLRADIWFYSYMLEDIAEHQISAWKMIGHLMCATLYFLAVMIGGVLFFRWRF